MPVEVLLRRSIEGVGRVGEIVRVKPGFARNYLLPNQYAALVSTEALKMVDKDKAREAIREAQVSKERAALAERLEAITVSIEARAGEDGHLYGSVGARQVLDALKKHGYAFEERHVRFEPVRELGAYDVPIHLAKEHVVKVKLQVVQEEEEAKSQAEEKARREAYEARRAAAGGEREQAAPPPAPMPVAEEPPAKKPSKGKKS
jgi:large subunit ribosomal protein L9